MSLNTSSKSVTGRPWSVGPEERTHRSPVGAGHTTPRVAERGSPETGAWTAEEVRRSLALMGGCRARAVVDPIRKVGQPLVGVHVRRTDYIAKVGPGGGESPFHPAGRQGCELQFLLCCCGGAREEVGSCGGGGGEQREGRGGELV